MNVSPRDVFVFMSILLTLDVAIRSTAAQEHRNVSTEIRESPHKSLLEVLSVDPNSEFQIFTQNSKSWSDNKNRNRFVAVGDLNREQLTKSRMHFGEVLAYAKSHNRTLVLPFCGNGTVGSSAYCNLHLSAYFDVDVIGSFIEWVREDYFRETLYKSYKSVYYMMLMEADDQCDHDIISQMVKPFLQDPMSSLNFGCVKCENGKFDGTWNSPEADVAELVVIVKKSFYACVEQGNMEGRLEGQNHLRYPGHYISVAKRFANQFLGSRYIAVHWRMERTIMMGVSKVEFLSTLSSLRNILNSHLKESNVTGIFIATDISLNEKKFHSSSLIGTSKKKLLWMKNALKTLQLEFNPPEWEDYEPHYAHLDSGIRGILDKLVCSRSYIFLYPRNMESSYLAEILQIRSSPYTIFNQEIAPEGAVSNSWN